MIDQKLIDRAKKRSGDIYLVRGKDTTDRQAWYYVLVDRSKKKAFDAAEGTPNLKLTVYGVILTSGYGDNPPSRVVKLMRDECNYAEAHASPGSGSCQPNLPA